MAIKVIKNQKVIKQIVEEFPQPEGSKFDQLFFEVLIADMVFGQKHFVKYRATNESTFLLEHETKINTFYKKSKLFVDYLYLLHLRAIFSLHIVKDSKESKSDIVELSVRYIRVNQIKTSRKDLIVKLKEHEYCQKEYVAKKTSFEQFMKLALEMEAKQFMVDYHFDDILLFRNDDIKDLTELDLYKEENMFAIQDKVLFV